ncbi:HPP family protein [Stutzerimonas kirkiae]|uniref:HPP family protein n=1 Tax=Stutzerimonas kirkiae TaxID=2211392 RepID=UPI0010385393|nr:HPP family protein [Stutzerimonas kirkiae]TBV14929.1 HPP family protein [Stutzerimonas kirkiae]
MPTALLDWFRSFFPDVQAAHPREWLRALCGASLGVALVLSLGSWLFGMPVALLVIAPAGASAVVLFCAPSSTFSQPWSVLAGSVLATLVGEALGHSGLAPVLAAVLAIALTLLGQFWLRCLHPPGGALVLVASISSAQAQQVGFELTYTVMFNSLLLIALALLYNNLTGHTYPRAWPGRKHPHQTADPSPAERNSPSQDDIERALDEFGSYVDVTREDLARLIRQTEKHALRRSMGEVLAAEIMSRDVLHGTPDTFIEQAWRQLKEHRLRAMPVVEEGSGRLLGIVTLVDLLKHFQPRQGRLSFGQLRYLRGTKLRSVMTTPAIAAREDTHMVELVSMLCDDGLHCLPVTDAEGRLVGMLTQTDLIAALYRNWLQGAVIPD